MTPPFEPPPNSPANEDLHRRINSNHQSRLADGDSQLGDMLRSLPPRVPPARLTASLLALAARERQRVVAGSSRNRSIYFPSIIQFETGFHGLASYRRWIVWFQLVVQNMMRPLAVPFAGGVFSALALFGLWVVPAYPELAARGRADVPTNLNTSAKIKGTSLLMGVSGTDVVLDIMVNGQGRMVDYSVVSGGGNLTDQRVRTGLENMLLFTEFVPATAFGKPRAGKMRLSLSSSSINVKG